MEGVKTYTETIGGKTLSVEIGKLAGQANGAVRAQLGDTVVLATVVMSKEPRSQIDYFPLSVEFDEKLYAAGRIKGSRWVKREGRPSDEAILSARLIDRTLRPLFDHKLRNEVQIIAAVLSFDQENDPDVVAIFASSLALCISNIPWNGPVSAVRVGEHSDNFVINPSYAEREERTLDLVVSGPAGVVNMLEGRAAGVSEARVAEAIKSADQDREKLIELQKKITKEIGVEKISVQVSEEKTELFNEIAQEVEQKLEAALFTKAKDERREGVDTLRTETIKIFEEKYPEKSGVEGEVREAFEKLSKKIVQRNVLNGGKRVDGRALDEIRPLSSEIGVLPRTHGSAIFNRGSTQALSVLTLGAPGLEQSLETMEQVGTKRFMHHYNFPPYSTGETGRMFTGRREIGHGALAENAILPVIPAKENFPYVVRIVTEILSSNGSTSMASVCGSTLALMDAGVPILAPVAGISTGIVIEDEDSPEKNYALLTDIQGTEDFYGHMDFKVAGTAEGVTAVQVDMKVRGITHKIIKETLERAHEARMKILSSMAQTIDKPRAELSPHAPRVVSIQINPEKIRNVIGPGGKIINEITAETGVAIDIEDSGLVFITATDPVMAEKAREWVHNLTRDVQSGETFLGKVVRLLNFGAFVEILPGQQGLVHVSELSDEYVAKVEDKVKVGDMVRVKVKNIDEEGRINLSMKGVDQNPEEKSL